MKSWVSVLSCVVVAAWLVPGRGLAQQKAAGPGGAPEKKAVAVKDGPAARKDGAAGAAKTDLDFSSVLDAGDEVLKGEMQEGPPGDMKEFPVVTDEDISKIEVDDVYKNQSSYFKVAEIRAKGVEGGRFIVRRTSGQDSPGRVWQRVSGLGPLTIQSRETLFDTYMNGGIFMHPISFCLLGTLVIALSNALIYRRKKQCAPSLVQQCRAALVRGDIPMFESIARTGRGVMSVICRAMVVNLDISTEDDIRIRCESEARRQVNALRLPLRALNLFAAVSPLLGLLGTVQGMIMCFDSLSYEQASAAKSQMMAAGIKVALYTTFYGLTVAIPALFIYFVSNQVLNNIVAECEEVTVEFSHRLALTKRG